MNKKFCGRELVAIFIVLATLISTACNNDTLTSAQKTFFALDTVITITAYGVDENVLNDCEKLVNDYEKMWSTTISDSEISLVNQNKTAVLSDETVDLLQRAIGIGDMTGGAFDVTIRPAMLAWGFTTDSQRVPNVSERELAAAAIDYRKIKISDNIVKIEQNMLLDFGGIAKGYISDKIKELLVENGATAAIINVGGNIDCLGASPEKDCWTIAVENPDSDGYICKVDIADKSAVTSGGYQRYFIGDDGEMYWHILDPFTAAPARSDILSVTIIGNDGLYCDAMSTALFVIGNEKAAEIWQQKKDFDFIIVTVDGGIFITEGISEQVKLLDNYINSEITVIS